MTKNIPAELDEITAIAILQANTHGRKYKLESPVVLAKACKFLFDKYKDHKTVSKVVKTIK